jgi:hypothetical protein
LVSITESKRGKLACVVAGFNCYQITSGSCCLCFLSLVEKLVLLTRIEHRLECLRQSGLLMQWISIYSQIKKARDGNSPVWWRASISPPGARVVKRASSSSSSTSSWVRSRVAAAAFAFLASWELSSVILSDSQVDSQQSGPLLQEHQCSAFKTRSKR